MTSTKLCYSVFLLFIFVHASLTSLGAQVPLKLRSTLCSGGASQLPSDGRPRLTPIQCIGQESVINSFRINGHMLRQGFLQPLKNKDSNKNNSSEYLLASLSPNPFSQNITVHIVETISESLYYSLYDLTGRMVFSNISVSTQKLTMNLGHLTPGIYILKLNTPKKIFTAKLIKE